jgi:hypothetical protein
VTCVKALGERIEFLNIVCSPRLRAGNRYTLIFLRPACGMCAWFVLIFLVC